MQGLVQTWVCPDDDILAGCVFQGYFSHNTWGLLQRVQFASLGQSLSLSEKGSSRKGCLFLLTSERSTHFLSVPWYTVTHYFPSST